MGHSGVRTIKLAALVSAVTVALALVGSQVADISHTALVLAAIVTGFVVSLLLTGTPSVATQRQAPARQHRTHRVTRVHPHRAAA